jgi:Holliday junction resolvasome RuvABC ATP-dependent DNA helicase subunit
MPRRNLFIVPNEQPLRQRVPNNLPVQPTTLIGRETETEAIRSLLRPAQEQGGEARFVTLVGPGGVGKTRLALQVAEELLEQFEDGVYLVDLAPA